MLRKRVFREVGATGCGDRRPRNGGPVASGHGSVTLTEAPRAISMN